MGDKYIPIPDETKEKLLKENIIVISSDEVVNNTNLICNILKFAADKPEQELQLYITAFYDDYSQIMPIYDVLQAIPNPIKAIGIGRLSCYSTLLLASCNKGKRYILRNTTLEIQQPSGGLGAGQNQQTMVTIESNNVEKERNEYERLLALHTGKDAATIRKDDEFGLTLHGEDAVKYGLIDKVI